MKKFGLLLSLFLASAPALAKLNVFACEPEWAALAVEIGGEHVEAYSATTARQDPHRIQARPSLIAKTRQTDLLICSGAELEIGWLPLLLQKSANRNIQPGQPGHLMAAEQVERLGMKDHVDRSMGDVHGMGNPHVHLDPRRLLQIAEKLQQRLQTIDPDNSDYYQNRLVGFQQRLEQAMAQWQRTVESLKGKKLVVHHDNWIYLTSWLGMEMVATLEPKPGLPPSSKHLNELVQKLEASPADLIMYGSYQDSKPSLWLSNKTGVNAVAIPSTVTNWQKDNALLNWYGEVIQLLSQD